MLPDGLQLPGSRHPITYSKLLLVEGQDAFQFFKALLRYLRLLDEIEIRNFGGVDDLGMLETLCLQAVSSDPVMPCIDQYLQCVRDLAGTEPSNPSKAYLHTFLASRPEPGLLLGQAAHRNYLPWDSPAFNDVKQFIQTL
jgi:hypothetical protein